MRQTALFSPSTEFCKYMKRWHDVHEEGRKSYFRGFLHLFVCLDVYDNGGSNSCISTLRSCGDQLSNHFGQSSNMNHVEKMQPT